MAEQLALFAEPSARPEGLGYARSFIPYLFERELVAGVQSLPLQPFQFCQYEGKRRVVSFGFRYDYSLHRLLLAQPIPDWLTPLIKQAEAFGGPGTRIGQVLCTEYERGVGIGWHSDKPQFERVFGVSLGSPCRLRLRKLAAGGWERFTLDVEPRSIYLMEGPARYAWEHSIPAVEEMRYSITLRTLAANPANLASDHSDRSDP